MKKLILIGSQGSGKSYLARQLGRALEVPVYHLDEVFWETWGPPLNITPTKEDITHKINELISGDGWIIDGNFKATLPRRIEACDQVVFLQTPQLLCIWRVLVRALSCRISGPLRPFEKVSIPLVKHIWRFPEKLGQGMMEIIQGSGSTDKVVVLASKAEIKRFIEEDLFRLETG